MILNIMGNPPKLEIKKDGSAELVWYPDPTIEIAGFGFMPGMRQKVNVVVGQDTVASTKAPNTANTSKERR